MYGRINCLEIFDNLIWIIDLAEISDHYWQPSWILGPLLKSKLSVTNLIGFLTLKNIYLEVNIVNLWETTDGLWKCPFFCLFDIFCGRHFENGRGEGMHPQYFLCLKFVQICCKDMYNSSKLFVLVGLSQYSEWHSTWFGIVNDFFWPKLAAKLDFELSDD